MRPALLLLLFAACGFSARVEPGATGDASIDARDRDGVADTEFRRTIEIVDAAVVGGPHESFPLLVSLQDDALRDVANAGHVATADGADIRFTIDAGGAQQLVRELEVYNPLNGRLVAWVSVPMLEASTVIYLHYGNPAATATGEPATVWTTAGYAGVWHLATLADSAGNSAAATQVIATQGNGKVAGGRAFGAANAYLDLGSDAAIDDVFANGGSLEAWFLATSFGEGSYGRVLDKGHQLGWSFGVNNVTPLASFFFVHGRQSAFGQWNTTANTVTTGTWHHVAVTYDRGSVANDATIVLDGATYNLEVQAPSGNVTADGANAMYAGNRSTLDRDFAGNLDELRISSSARSTGWFATSYANQSDPATFYTVSAEE